jgi:hypothetical protein
MIPTRDNPDIVDITVFQYLRKAKKTPSIHGIASALRYSREVIAQSLVRIATESARKNVN